MNQMPDLPDVPEEAFVTEPSQLGALDSPLRFRILKACDEPRSVREIAEALQMPVTRLYYHVNLLNEAGFLPVVHTRKTGARLEKLYRVAGKTITPGPEFVENVGDPSAAARAVMAVVIEPMRADAEAALEKRFAGDEQPVSLSRGLAILSRVEAEAFSNRLADLVQEFMSGSNDSTDPDARSYAFTYALLPTDMG